MSSEIAIKIEKLSKVYKLYTSAVARLKESLDPFRRQYHHDFYALNSVSFEIKKGDSVGIIGKNGSGKSTLLKILTGVLTPTSGSVTVNGKVSALLELGAGFNPELTGLENVYFNGMLMGYSREEMDEKLDEILSFADIGEFVYQPVKTYSSGMFVRLAFAVAVNVEPDILIVDEALSVGDVFFQSKSIDKIKKMTEGGVTTLFVTHDMNTVNTLCNQAIMLDAGEVFNQGKPQLITLQYFQLVREREWAAQLDIPRGGVVGRNKSISETIKAKNTYEDYRYGTGAAKILDCQLIDCNGRENHLLEAGKCFKLQMKIQFTDDVENPCYGYVISNTAGQNLLSAHSYFDLQNTHVLQKKHSEIVVEIASTMLLNPGKYLLSIGVAVHTTVNEFINLDARKNFCTIEVYGCDTKTGLIYHTPTYNITNI